MSSTKKKYLKNASRSPNRWTDDQRVPQRNKYSFLANTRTNLKNVTSRTFWKQLVLDRRYTWTMSVLLLTVEAVITFSIVSLISYTEIDWKAYMQEVEGFLNGTLDYQHLKGDTGPLVYPAGFVYVFSGFYFLTQNGINVKLGQWIFAVFYVAFMYQVFSLYSKSLKVPPYALMFLTLTSYRIHSIFVLRLFNDPIAMFFLYLALNKFLEGKWTLGSLSYSFAVSIKMNCLLYSPALLVLYLTQLSFFDSFVQLTVCGTLQLMLALPFLFANPWSYVSRSFDLGRIFLFEWTVNWKFLPEDIFVSRYFHLLLFLLHFGSILIFLPYWMKSYRSYVLLKKISNQYQDDQESFQIKNQLVLTPLFICNFIGIIYSRSLHYQFYVWYYHTIPYLLWCTHLPVKYKLVIFGLIEMCWNVFPATYWSSLVLLLCHLTVLFTLWSYSVPRKDWSQLTTKKNT